MSDEWFYRGSHRKSSINWVPLLVAVLLVVNVGVVMYTTMYANEQVKGLNEKIGVMTTSIEILKAQASDANEDIMSLKKALQSGVINVTAPSGVSDELLINLYNNTRESVVLITVRTSSGTAQGSGFIYDSSGRIITNYHVVENAISITVTFIDGTIVKADEVIGKDPYSDIAVIKVSNTPFILKSLRLGDSSKLKVGERVIAIGNPYGLANTLTSGIVSAVGRQMDSSSNYPIVDVIQTDAAINPGNSGGPLLNIAGEVVGINTAIPTETSRGIGFAVPSNTIARELPSLLSKGTYDHPYLGIQGQPLSPSIVEAMNLPTGTHGTLIIEVTTGGPADIAGLRGSTKTVTIEGEPTKVGGDVILGVDETEMKNFYDLIVYLQRYKSPGDIVKLKVIRDNNNLDVTIKLGTRPQP